MRRNLASAHRPESFTYGNQVRGTFAYNAGGTTTVYILSGTKMIAEYAAGAAPTAPTREYIYSGSQLLATHEGSSVKYHHGDHLSIRVTTDSAGTIAAQRGHYPFGESWYSSGVGDKWQFTSYERDGESGLDYAMFRYDSSRLGRFMTPDPLAGSILNPESLNRYAYVRNDPVNLIDPLGLFAWPPVESFMDYYSGEIDPWHMGGGGGMFGWFDPWFAACFSAASPGCARGAAFWNSMRPFQIGWDFRPAEAGFAVKGDPLGPRQTCERNCNYAYAMKLMYCTVVGLANPLAGIGCIVVATAIHIACHAVCARIPEDATW